MIKWLENSIQKHQFFYFVILLVFTCLVFGMLITSKSSNELTFQDFMSEDSEVLRKNVAWVLENPSQVDSSVLLLSSGVAFKEGGYEDSVFLYELGNLRYGFELSVFPKLAETGEDQASLLDLTKKVVLGYAEDHPDVHVKALKRLASVDVERINVDKYDVRVYGQYNDKNLNSIKSTLVFSKIRDKYVDGNLKFIKDEKYSEVVTFLRNYNPMTSSLDEDEKFKEYKSYKAKYFAELHELAE